MYFLKNGPNLASFCLFSFLSHDKHSTNLTINDKNIDGVLGTQTWAAGWLVQMNPLSYGGTPKLFNVTFHLIKSYVTIK